MMKILVLALLLMSSLSSIAFAGSQCALGGKALGDAADAQAQSAEDEAKEMNSEKPAETEPMS